MYGFLFDPSSNDHKHFENRILVHMKLAALPTCPNLLCLLKSFVFVINICCIRVLYQENQGQFRGELISTVQLLALGLENSRLI